MAKGCRLGGLEGRVTDGRSRPSFRDLSRLNCAVTDQSHSANFRPRGPNRIWNGLHSNMASPCSIRFIAIRRKLAECLRSVTLQFSPISMSQWKKMLRASVRSILMAPTSHIASLNRHTPKLSGVGLKLTWCQAFGVHLDQVTQIRVHQNRRF